VGGVLDKWAHLCTVGAEQIDPLDTLGITSDRPMPYWGWGNIPDQYGQRWDGDDSETPPPADPAGVAPVRSFGRGSCQLSRWSA